MNDLLFEELAKAERDGDLLRAAILKARLKSGERAGGISDEAQRKGAER